MKVFHMMRAYGRRWFLCLPFFLFVAVLIAVIPFFSFSQEAGIAVEPVSEGTLSEGSGTEEAVPAVQTFSDLSLLISNAQIYLAEEYEIQNRDLEFLRALYARAQESTFQELANKSRMMLYLAEMKKQSQDRAKRKDVLGTWTQEQERLRREEAFSKTFSNVLFWESLTFGAFAFVLSNIFYHTGNSLYREYLASSSPEEALVRQGKYLLADNLTGIFTGIGIGGTALLVLSIMLGGASD